MATINDIITKDETGQELVKEAKALGERAARDGLKKAQIRNIFSEIRQIEETWRVNPVQAARKLNLLKPKLTYQVKRQGAWKSLAEAIAEGIDAVASARTDDEKDGRFQKFVELVEATLAYHYSKS